MISNDNDKLYRLLCCVSNELRTIENPLQEGLNIKTNRSIENYRKNIELNCKYILSRSNYKVVTSIEKYMKKKEKVGNEEKNKWGFIETN